MDANINNIITKAPSPLDNVFKGVTSQIMKWVVDEVSNKEIVNAKVKENLVIPILRIIQDQITPYAILTIIFAVFLFILAITNLMFIMLLYFRRSNL
jgi:hypothetical protein